MDLIELSLILLAVALIGAAARRIPIPAPLCFILGGAALSFEPHLRAVKLDPQIFFLLFIPPLLFSELPLVTPFAAYLAGESVQVPGILGRRRGYPFRLA